MATIRVGNNFNSGLVGNQVTGIYGTNIYALGNVFSIQSNVDEKTDSNNNIINGSYSELLSLDDISDDLNTDINYTNFSENEIIIFKNDNTKLAAHALFGSLSERFRVAIEQIIETFPYSLFISNLINGQVKINILDYEYDSVSNLSNFNIPISCIINKGRLKYSLLDNSNVIESKNLLLSYLDYCIMNSTGELYNVIDFVGITSSSDTNIKVTVLGNPFPDAVGGTLSTNYHIRPNVKKVNTFYDTLDELELYLLNTDNSVVNKAVFLVADETADGSSMLVEKEFIWPASDGYNIDTGESFKSYQEDLITLGKEQDEFKTDLIQRFLTSDSIKEYDTETKKVTKLLRIYGRAFDDILKYINHLSNVYTVTYDGKDNVPDILVKHLSKTMGWDTINLFSGDDNSALNPKNIDIWRIILINTPFIFKSKGIRSIVEIILDLLGVPKSLMDIKEHVYLLSSKVNMDLLDDETKSLTDLDVDGYPYFKDNDLFFYFQQTKDASDDLGIGYFDSFKYLEPYGYTINKVVDNIKSWSNNDHINDDNVTNYSVLDERLVINTKEVNIYMDAFKLIENIVYERYLEAGGDVHNMTSEAFIASLYLDGVNAKNRKISTNTSGGYPELYNTYLEDFQSTNNMTMQDINACIDSVNSSWVDVVKQLVPATIIGNISKTYRNTIFGTQKYVYLRGINDGSEFVTPQEEQFEYNVEMSETFTRNNCAPGYAGSDVVYTVPAGTYGAETQEEADQMALDDINANGQNYANDPTHGGTCTALSLPFKWIGDIDTSYCEETIVEEENFTGLGSPYNPQLRNNEIIYLDRSLDKIIFINPIGLTQADIPAIVAGGVNVPSTVIGQAANPNGWAYNPTTDYAYVQGDYTGGVVCIRLSDGAIIKNFAGGSNGMYQRGNIINMKDLNQVWALGNSLFKKIDLTTNEEVVTGITLPTGVTTVLNQNNKIYAVRDFSLNQIDVYNQTTGALITTINGIAHNAGPTGGYVLRAPYSDPDKNRIYIGEISNTPNVVIIDTTTDTIIKRVDIPKETYTYGGIGVVNYNPIRNKLYIGGSLYSATNGSDSVARLWSLNDSDEIDGTLSPSANKTISDIIFYPNNNSVYISSLGRIPQDSPNTGHTTDGVIFKFT